MMRRFGGGVALAVMVALASAVGGCGPGVAAAGGDQGQGGGRQAGQVMPVNMQGGPQQGFGGQGGDPMGAMQALQGLTQIRRQQCQMGNSLACQALPQIPGYGRQLSQFIQGCQSGNRQACAGYQSLAQRINTAYTESAAVMRQGEQGMAQMNAWRAQMNANAANSMANLQAQAARGQAAHEARQQSYAAQNQAWQAGQAAGERNQGRFVDGIYEGTTMSGGGVQSRIDYGSTGYTDGNGNVVAVPNGAAPPDGYQQMDPTYAAPD